MSTGTAMIAGPLVRIDDQICRATTAKLGLKYTAQIRHRTSPKPNITPPFSSRAKPSGCRKAFLFPTILVYWGLWLN